MFIVLNVFKILKSHIMHYVYIGLIWTKDRIAKPTEMDSSKGSSATFPRKIQFT